VIVDSHGREVGKLGSEPAEPGQSLKLTIDLDIQRAAENALGERNGTIIALDPHTGEILALVSRPTFDPNQFAVRIGRGEWSKLITDPHHPLLNKAIQAQLAPGSTFKIIMSVAGLEQGVAEDMKVNCAGGASFYGHFFACDHKHGMVDIQHAIPWSCDTFYYTLAQRLGIDTIAEATGIMPSTEWKMKNYHEKWYAGETISVGIGQGAVAVTPIQLLRALAGVASGGALKRPHLVFPDEVPAQYQQAVLDSFPGSHDENFNLDPSNWETITDGMFEAVNGSGYSTAAASRLDGIDFAGKTGTAQVISHEGLSKKGKGGRSMQPNSWFVGLAPRRNPDIAVVVLWENGDWGSNSARLGAQIISAYVTKQRRMQNNLQLVAQKPAPIEVGAVESSSPAPVATAKPPAKPAKDKQAYSAGHFFIDSDGKPTLSPAKPRPADLAAAVR
jgi:penicillin-binding protein 2